MKKTYIIPTVQTVIINQRQHLLAGSELGVGDPGSANEAESRRRGNLWDDEDEDEEYEDY